MIWFIFLKPEIYIFRKEIRQESIQFYRNLFHFALLEKNNFNMSIKKRKSFIEKWVESKSIQYNFVYMILYISLNKEAFVFHIYECQLVPRQTSFGRCVQSKNGISRKLNNLTGNQAFVRFCLRPKKICLQFRRTLNK